MTEAALVVVAAGDGQRLGAGRPKALVEVAGQTMLRRSVAAASAAGVATIVVVHHPDHRAAFAAALEGLAVTALVAGGASRAASVRAGVAAALAVAPRPGVVAIHDAARCLTPPRLYGQVLGAVAGDVIAAAPGRPVADTLKIVDGDGEVTATRDRADLWAVHTPQAVASRVWDAVLAWEGADSEVTDDLGLVERARAAGVVEGTIRLLRSDGAALKITWPSDLAIAEALVGRTSEVA